MRLVFRPKIVCAFVIPLHGTCLTHHIYRDLITQPILDKDFKLLSSLVRNFLRPFILSRLLIQRGVNMHKGWTKRQTFLS